jgi:hypothetical protein
VNGGLERSLGLGDPYHIGIAVWDLDDAMTRLGKTLGLERWGTLEAEVPSEYRGAESLTGIRSGFARSGGMIIELVQPTLGAFTAQTFLDERGEGIYHLGYWVEDMNEALRKAAAIGIGVDWSTPAGDSPFAVYLDSAPTLGVHIELVGVAMRPIIDGAMKKAEST